MNVLPDVGSIPPSENSIVTCLFSGLDLSNSFLKDLKVFWHKSMISFKE